MVRKGREGRRRAGRMEGLWGMYTWGHAACGGEGRPRASKLPSADTNFDYVR